VRGAQAKGTILPEYSYHDIFATKGIEYMVVMAYFILFVFFTKALNKSKKRDKKLTGKD
jgi:hypothetical protein